LAADIYAAIQTGYNALTAPYLHQGTADRVELLKLVEHVRAATNRDAVVYGTKLALQQFTPQFVQYGGQMIDQRNQDGFFRVIDGIRMVEIRQAHTPGTDNFAIGNDFVLVVPQGEEKIVKVVLEGDPVIREVQNMNADDSIEYEFRKKYGVGVITSTRYGAFILA
jgi:hypothetical protein